MKKIKHILTSLTLLGTVLFPVAVSASPLTQFGATCTNRPVLGMPSWYNGLQCETLKVNGVSKQQPKFTDINQLWVIALNVVQMMIIAAGYVAAGFIIWGGFKYTKSRGDPAKIAEAKKAITDAVIGLGIALLSVGIVVFIQGLIT